MEAKGIYEQVRLAVEAAQRGKLDQMASAQSTVDIDWEVERDDKPQAGAPDEKDVSEQHHRVWAFSDHLCSCHVACLPAAVHAPCMWCCSQ